MSERRRPRPVSAAIVRAMAARAVLPFALLASLAGSRAVAQGTDDLGAWQQRRRDLLRRVAEADAALRAAEGEGTFDRAVRVDGVEVAYRTGTFDSADSAAVASGLRQALDALRDRHGAGGLALVDGARWTITPTRRARGGVLVGYDVRRADARHESTGLPRGFGATDLERLVLAHAGEKLTRRVPGLRWFNGNTALQPSEAVDAEVGRRLATSTSATTRRCWNGAIAACATILAPFDRTAPASRYYDPSEYRHVVIVARMPALGDSAFFDQRRRCIDDSLSTNIDACTAAVGRLDLPDPLNPQIRGSLLGHALQLGGRGALDRAVERPDAQTLDLLAHIAGVGQDSLLRSWHARLVASLARERGAGQGALIVVTSLAWGALFLAAALRRRYL